MKTNSTDRHKFQVFIVRDTVVEVKHAAVIPMLWYDVVSSSLLPIVLAGNVIQSVVSVCLSVRLSVRLFPFYPLNRLTFELEILRV